MPFFSAAFAAVAPSDVRLRWTAVGAVGLGAAGVATGVTWLGDGVAATGAVAFIGGIVLTGWATVRPLRGALGPSRGLITEAYVVALAEVAVGAAVATFFVAAWSPVTGAWGHLKPAHGWLNLVGFVSLVIATTLLHFFPTVIGARIAVHRSARVTVVGLAAGAPIVAAGYATLLGPPREGRRDPRAWRCLGAARLRLAGVEDARALDDRPRLAPVRDDRARVGHGVVRGRHRHRGRPRARVGRRSGGLVGRGHRRAAHRRLGRARGRRVGHPPASRRSARATR